MQEDPLNSFVTYLAFNHLGIKEREKKMITGVAHIGLYIKDVERSIRFYEDVLGFKMIQRFTSLEGNLMAFVKSGNLIIELIQHVEWMDRKDGLFDHIAMEVEDIEAVSAELKSKGIEFEDDIYFDKLVTDTGVKYQAFRGPDGEHLEIYQYM